jgi:hypothetical protein
MECNCRTIDVLVILAPAKMCPCQSTADPGQQPNHALLIGMSLMLALPWLVQTLLATHVEGNQKTTHSDHI